MIVEYRCVAVIFVVDPASVMTLPHPAVRTRTRSAYRAIVIGAGLEAISFNTRRLDTVSRLSRAAIAPTNDRSVGDLPGVNSFTVQLTRTASAAARESTPDSGGTGTKKTGGPGNSTPPPLRRQPGIKAGTDVDCRFHARLRWQIGAP